MELTLGEVKPIIKYIIENNKKLEDKGMPPVSINLVSRPGIGKSALCEQIAKELDANYIFLSLSMLTEPSDLVGFPIKQHYICKGTEDDMKCEWVSSELLDLYIADGWKPSTETRMSYAIPEWMVGLDPNKPTIMLMDDYSRKF